MQMMDCKRTHELLGPLVDRELPLDLSRSVLAHLEACAQCRAEADAIRSLRLIVRELAGRAPTGLRARILSEAPARHAGSVFTKRLSTRRWVWSRAAAVLVGAASAALWFVPLTSLPRSAAEPRSPFHQLIFESQDYLELDGSFVGEFRALARRPEGRLLSELTGGR